jgi:tRNA pseudouridine55 synthase
MVLGQTSTTGDPEGDISVSKPLMQPPIQATVEAALASFEGLISQVPPAYSAIKVNGQRSYALARAGKAVPLAPRQVTVYSLQLVSYDYPTIRLTARVSSGTYIRTLVADIGTALNTSAYTTELRRTSVGDLQIDDAYTTEQITIDQLRKLQDHPVALW